VFKLIKNATNYIWPTNAFKIWKKENRETGNLGNTGIVGNTGNVGHTQIAMTESHIRDPNEEEAYAAEAAQH
jgi:hypothetical protein